MNNLAFYLARIYYILIGQNVNPIPYGFTDSYYAEKIYRHIAGLPSGLSGGKNVSFWLELWFYHRTGQTHRLATGTRPAWFWLSKLYASYAGLSTEGVLQSASAEFWAEKLLNILPAEISLTVNSIAQADNSTFTPSNPILGTVVQYTVLATNNGTANLTLQNATRSGAVTAVTVWSSNVLIPGASATCTITLDTATSGVQTGYFEFINNDPDDNESVYRVNVSYTVLNVSALWALNFNVDAGAPLPSPYTENSSTATLVQVDGQFSKSSGAMQFPAQTTPTWGDQGLYRASTFTRAAGLAIVFKVNLSTVNQIIAGFGDAGGASYTNIADIATFSNAANLTLTTSAADTIIIGTVLSAATDYYIAAVALSSGTALYIKGGTYIAWTLLFHTNISVANLAPLFANFDAAGALDHIHVGQIAAAHALASGIKFTLDQATPAVNTNYTGEDDGVTTLYYTLPGAPGADEVDLFYNYTDANDCWRVLMNYTGVRWDIYLYSIVGGGVTAHINVSDIGDTNAIRIIRRGNVHRLYTRNTSNVWTKQGADVTNAAHAGVAITRVETVGASWTLAQLTAAPSTDAAYTVLDEV